MRSETVTVNYYSFAELDDKAKERARDWFRETFDYGWHDENRQSLEAFCREFPVDAREWSYDPYSFNISARFTGDETHEELSGNRLRTFLVNNFAHLLQGPKVYRKGPYSSDQKSRKSRIFSEEASCPFTGYCFDENLLDDVRAFIKKPDGRSYSELLSDCLYNWAKAARDDWASCLEDDYIETEFNERGAEFSERGKFLGYGE